MSVVVVVASITEVTMNAVAEVFAAGVTEVDPVSSGVYAPPEDARITCVLTVEGSAAGVLEAQVGDVWLEVPGVGIDHAVGDAAGPYELLPYTNLRLVARYGHVTAVLEVRA